MVTKSRVEMLANRIDEVMAQLAEMDFSEEERKKVDELKESIEKFHEEGLRHLIKTIRQTEAGKERLYEAIDDPLVYAMLLHHGIIKQDLYTRVIQALEEVKPYIQSHGGDIELSEVKDNVVYVQLAGACSGCSLSAVTLKNGVEEIIKARVPEIEYVTMVNETVSSGYMPVEFQDRLRDTGWQVGPSVDQVGVEKPVFFTIADESILLFNSAGKMMAYRNRCPHRGTPFQASDVKLRNGSYVIDSKSGFQFDLSTGECISVPYIQLEPFPLRIEEGKIYVRLEK